MAAIRTNAGFILHYEEEIAAGRLPADLDDMPKYAQRPVPMLARDSLRDNLTPSPILPLIPFDPPAVIDTGLYFRGEPLAWVTKNPNPEKHLARLRIRIQDAFYREIVGNDPITERKTQLLNGVLDKVESGRTEVPYGGYSPRKPKAYIAGPMRGYEHYNFPAFDAAAEKLVGLGYTPVNPADLDREAMGLNFDAFVDTPVEELDMNAIIRRDVDEILALDPKVGDIVVLLEGWCASTGALAECRLAKWAGVPAFSITDVPEAKCPES